MLPKKPAWFSFSHSKLSQENKILPKKQPCLQETASVTINRNRSLSHNALQSQLQTHNPLQSQNPSKSPNSTSFFFILIIAIIGVLPTCLLFCFHIYFLKKYTLICTSAFITLKTPASSMTMMISYTL